jgi:signal transduction histidine kinase
MNASLAELLESLKPGLLWVNREGLVRYVNADASARTGMAPGRRLFDPDLLRTVAAVVAGKAPRAVVAVGAPAREGAGLSELPCRVIPGLGSDDAFVMIAADPSADHGAAFQNLLHVIHHDLLDPLEAASHALDAAQAGAAGSAMPLHDTVEELLKTLHKLVDLAALWGSSALLATDRIEVWPLLQDVWGELQPLAAARSVKVRFRAQGPAEQLSTIYGSTPWLRRVFTECMESALRSSGTGATLDIEHVQMGPRAVIIFRDCGVFAARHDDAVDLPAPAKGAKASPPRLKARDQIGLKLCQHIVQLHGGQLREEEDDGVHNFLIDLPTGAPSHADQSPIGVAQAQIYARDLSALMSRARAAAPHS